MPDSPSIKLGEKTYWTLEQTLAWIAWRDADRVNTAYREWRDRYYEPQLSDWRNKPPLIWDWRSPADELDGAAQALRQKCEAGALHGTGREGVGGPRREIASLRWPDLMLTDIAGMTGGLQLYDSSADSLAVMSGRVEPAFHDVLFVVADVLKAFPAPGEAEKNPALGEVKKASLTAMVAFCRGLKEVKRNRTEMDAALKAEFGPLPRETCDEVRRKAGFAGKIGRRPKPK